jgi:hypothetical protein
MTKIVTGGTASGDPGIRASGHRKNKTLPLINTDDTDRQDGARIEFSVSAIFGNLGNSGNCPMTVFCLT